MTPRNAGVSRQRRRLRPISVERLEERLCLASSAGLLADGTLVIMGDNRADSVEIYDDGLGLVGLIGQFDNLGAGAEPDPDETFDVMFDNVTKIVLDTKAGDDDVYYVLTDSLEIPRDVSFTLGSGNDSLSMDFGAILSTQFHVKVDLGRGNDTFDAGFYDEISASQIQVDIDGGLGNDDLSLYADSAIVDGGSSLVVAVSGGAGNDAIDAELDFDPESTGLVNIAAWGGKGNDDIEMNVTGADNLNSRRSFVLDGGAGRDNFIASPEILTSNVEPLKAKRK